MKKMNTWKKRAGCFLLALAMIVTSLPLAMLDFVQAAAEESQQEAALNQSKDDFGIPLQEELTEEEKAEQAENNPYGTTSWFNLYPVSELYIAQGDINKRIYSSYNYEGDIYSAVQGQQIGGRSRSGGRSMEDIDGVDADGEGQESYMAHIAFNNNADQKYIEIYLTDKTGATVSNTIELGRNDKNIFKYLEQAEGYHASNFMSIVAGDFDNDGVDSVIVYLPYMTPGGETPQIVEYTITKGGYGGHTLTRVENKVCDDTFKLINQEGVAREGSDTNKLRDLPLMSMVVEDVDNDNIDELIVTTSTSRADSGEIVNRSSYLIIYDKVGDTWNKTFHKALNGAPRDNDGTKTGRLRWSTSSVGNIEISGRTDFPEIISAGFKDGGQGNQDSISTDADNIGVMVTRCTEINEVKFGNSIGNYAVISAGNTVTGSEFVSKGLVSSYHIHTLLPVQAFASRGIGYAEDILIGASVYRFNNSSFEMVFQADYFNDKKNDSESETITANYIQEATAGNFDGNEEGREQVVFSTSLKIDKENKYLQQLYTYQMKTNTWDIAESEFLVYKAQDPVFRFTTFDCDSDGTIVRYADVSRTYTEPEVLVVLESAPYFKEVDGGDTGNSDTAYGESTAAGSSQKYSNSLSSNVAFGYEYKFDPLGSGLTERGAGFESTLKNHLTWSFTQRRYTNYSLEYHNDTGENQVVVCRRPVYAYKYIEKNTGGTLVVAKQGELATGMLSVKKYNKLAENYGSLEKIPDNKLGEAGDPMSYRSYAPRGAAVSLNSFNYGEDGTFTADFTAATHTEHGFGIGLDFGFSAYAMTFGMKAGGGVGYGTTSSKATYSTSEVSKFGSVIGKDTDGRYNFTWKFAHWVEQLNGKEIPFVGYVVSDVVAPPTPPENLYAEDITEDSFLMKWEAGNRIPEVYIISRVLDNGKRVEIARVSGDVNEMQINNLKAETDYTFEITAYTDNRNNSAVNGTSEASESLVVTTASEGISALQYEQPQDIEVQAGSQAVFQVKVPELPDGYRRLEYQWQKRESTADGYAWNDLNGETKSTLELDGVQYAWDQNVYRCKLVCMTDDFTPVEIVTKGALLSVIPVSVKSSISLEGAEGGSGSISDPYYGVADYRTGRIEQTESRLEAEIVRVGDLEVYECNYPYKRDTLYVGIRKNEEGLDEYYKLTKSEESYTVGEKLELRESDFPNSTFFGMKNKTIELRGVTYEVKIAFILDDPLNYIVSQGGYIDPVEDEGFKYLLYSNGTYYISNSNLEPLLLASAEDLENVIRMCDVLEKEPNWSFDSVYLGMEQSQFGDNYGNHYLASLVGMEMRTGSMIRFSGLGIYSIAMKNVLCTGQGVYCPQSWLDPVVTYVSREVPVAEYTDHAGTAIQVNGLAEPGVDALTVIFKNLTTGGTESYRQPVNASGSMSVNWKAASPGLYEITALAGGNSNYAIEVSDPLYYDARGSWDLLEQRKEEYRFAMKNQAGEQVVSYHNGDQIYFTLQSRDTTSADSIWMDVSEEVKNSMTYTLQSPDGTSQQLNDFTYTVKQAGIYAINGYKDNTTVAAGTFETKKNILRLAPAWEGTQLPETIQDIQLSILEGTIADEDLSKIFAVNCSYYEDNGAETDQTGTFQVRLVYQDTQEAVNFQRNYDVTLESRTAVVRSKNLAILNLADMLGGTVIARQGESHEKVESGGTFVNGAELTFKARASGSEWTLTGWKINGELIQSDNLPDNYRLEGNVLTIIADYEKDTVYTQADGRVMTVEAMFERIMPEVEITLGQKRWQTLIEPDQMEDFYLKRGTVIVNAEGSDAEYYSSLTALTKEQLDHLEDKVWTEYKTPIYLKENAEMIYYVRIPVVADSVYEYYSTDHIITDSQNPVISGMADGGEYQGSKMFSVSDDNLREVTLDGEGIALTEGAVKNYSISADNQEHVIMAVDHAGNTTVYTVTVRKTNINQVDLVGITAPKALQTPDMTADYTGEGILGITEISWNLDYGEVIFDYAKVYTVTILMQPKPETQFTRDTSVTVNGMKTDSVTVTEEGLLQVRHSFAATEKAPQDAPTSLQTQNTSLAGEQDGKILGVDSTMEYRSAKKETYITCTGTEVSGLEAGIYYVRYAETTGKQAGTDLEVFVGEGPEKTYTLSAEDIVFSDTVYGYEETEEKSLHIVSSGNVRSQIERITVNSSKFRITQGEMTIESGQTDTSWKVSSVPGIEAGTHSAVIRIFYNNGATAEAQIYFTVTKADQGVPENLQAVKPSYQGANDGKIIGLTKEMEYRKAGEITYTDCPEGSLEGLEAGIYYVRKKEDKNHPAGEELEVIIEEGPEASYLLNVKDMLFTEQIYGYETAESREIQIEAGGNHYSTIESITLSTQDFVVETSQGVAVTEPGAVNTSYRLTPAQGLFPGRYQATLTITYDRGAAATAEVVFVVRKAEQAAPEGLQAVAVSLAGEADGAIRNVSAMMEYRRTGEISYQSCPEEVLSGLEAGSYYVRMQETATHLASPDVRLLVEDGPEKTYVLSMEDILFAEEIYGYKKTQEKRIFISNDGNAVSTIQSMEIDQDCFVINERKAEMQVGAGEMNTSWSIQTVTGLDAGTYKGILTVTYDNGETAQSEITLTVQKAAQTAPQGLSPQAPSYEGDADGKILGTDPNMEYRMQGEESWQSCSGSELADLSAGIYYLRWKESDNQLAGAEVSLEVPEGVSRQYGLKVEDVIFSEKIYGYEETETKEIYLQAEGNHFNTIQEISVSGQNFVLDASQAENQVALDQANTTYRLSTVPGLMPGRYQATITVIYDDGKQVQAEAVFVVKKQTQEPPKDCTTVATTYVDDPDGEIRQVTEEMEYRGESETLYRTCPAGTIENLAAGTYYVRYRETDTIYASADTKLIVEAGPSRSKDKTLLLLKVGMKKNRQRLTWNKVEGADSYVIYETICTRKEKNSKLKKVKVVSGKKTSWNTKKREEGTYYKYKIVAKKGKKTLATSRVIHCYQAEKGSAYQNPINVKVSSKEITLAKGKQTTIEASVITGKDKKLPHHAEPKILYVSSNPKIAAVSKTGTIRGKAKGDCTIYVMALNGVYRKVTIHVTK